MRYLAWDPIDVGERHRLAADPRDGAAVEFVGMVRGEEAGEPIDALQYEAYAPMAERLIGRWVEEATARWSLHRIYVRHRLGRVPVGEIAVAIGVQAPHRAEAFAACQFLIDSIKRDAPIWKFTPSGSVGNPSSAGPAAAPSHTSSPARRWRPPGRAPRRTIAVVGSGRLGAPAPRHPRLWYDGANTVHD